MRYSRLFGRSSKAVSNKSQIRSHRLMLQAGYIRESVAGRYYFLPLGQRLRMKFMQVVRQEMDAVGALEMAAPVLHPLHLWKETNRDRSVGFELMQVKDRSGSGFALSGTAEEMFVDLVRKFNISYKDLPFNLYQFGLKFRDELRARGGLLRTREFIMKDAYSFSTAEQFPAIYEQMRDVYSAIFHKVGLKTEVVAADGGYIGGDYCHEFVVPAKVGESTYYKAGDYIAHEDVAVFDKSVKTSEEKNLALKKVLAKRGPSMKDSQRYHSPAPLEKHIKNVVYLNEKNQIVLACLRGDLTVNEAKLSKVAACHQLTPLSKEQVGRYLQSAPGFISPVKLKLLSSRHELLIVADDSLQNLVNAISGANQVDYDYLNINIGRDFKPDIVADIALVEPGFKSKDGCSLQVAQGIEVGNIFQLGYHYSDQMQGSTFVDSNGKPQKYYMGCYGIGIGRTLAAAAEVLSDEKGLVWPISVAPYQIYLLALNPDAKMTKLAEKLEIDLERAGIEVLYDDRLGVTSGEKLTNSDFMGIPLRFLLSKKSLQSSQVEVKCRQSGKIEMADLDSVVEFAKREIERLQKELNL